MANNIATKKISITLEDEDNSLASDVAQVNLVTDGSFVYAAEARDLANQAKASQGEAATQAKQAEASAAAAKKAEEHLNSVYNGLAFALGEDGGLNIMVEESEA